MRMFSFVNFDFPFHDRFKVFSQDSDHRYCMSHRIELTIFL